MNYRFFIFIIGMSSLLCAMDGRRKPVHLAILVSGEGTNMAAILDAKIEGIRPCVVISSKPDVQALIKAQVRGIPREIIESKKKNDPEYSPRLIECLQKYDVTPENGLICLAGFMRILDEQFIRHFKDKILNIHPSLLPHYPGLDAIGQALRAKAKVTGCTVHLVDEGVDTGTIIAQSEEIPIDEGDTPQTLQEKVHAVEHKLYPNAIGFVVRRMHEGSCIRRLLLNG